VKRRVFLILLLLLLPFCALADSGLSETQSGAASQERAGAETAFSWQTLTGTDGSEERERLIGSLDLSSWQAAADEAGAQLNVMETLTALARGEAGFSPEGLWQLLCEIVLGEARGMRGRLMLFMGPALLWGISRQLTGGDGPGGAAGYVCFLSGAGAMLSAFASQMELARTTIRRLGSLTEQVFPVLTALMSSTGRAGTAGLLGPLAAFGGGALTALTGRIAVSLCGGAAVLAVAGNLSGRIRLSSLFSLFCAAGKWLLGAVMTVFLAMIGLCGVIGPAQDGVTLRAARYAADSLLPVVGGDIADAMDGMAASAALVRSAAGVTGVIVMLAVCLRPVIRLTLGLLTLRLAAALTEPVADGPLISCAGQLGKATQLLLAAVSVSAALFVTLTGVCIGSGG